MSGVITAVAVGGAAMAAGAGALTAVALGAGAGLFSSMQSDNQDAMLQQQKAAQQQALDIANRQAYESDQAMNRANQKRPDTMNILGAAQQAAKGGVSGTMLTGATGIKQEDLVLGKSTLLGK